MRGHLGTAAKTTGQAQVAGFGSAQLNLRTEHRMRHDRFGGNVKT